MISYNVNIPEEKQSCFQEFLDAIGGEYVEENSPSTDQQSINETEIPEWHNKIVLERLEDYRKNPNENMDFDELMENLRKKYV